MKLAIPKNRKVLTVAVVCVLLISVFWVFIYVPAVRKMKSLKQEIDGMKKEISQIEARGGEKGADIKKMVDSIRSDFDLALKKLPAQEEDVLKFISTETNKNKLDIFSMTPGPKKPMVINGAAVMLEGRQCMQMPVSIEIRSTYKAFRECLETFRKDNPYLMMVEDIDIQKDAAAAPRLKIKMELMLYLGPENL